MKVLIWGTGNTAREIIKNGVNGEVIGFIRSSPPPPPAENTFCGKLVYTPDKIDAEYDMICVASIYGDEIYDTLKKYEIPMEKVCFVWLPNVLGEKRDENYEKAKRILGRKNLLDLDDFIHYDNQDDRDLLVTEQLEKCVKGKTILDAGAGEQRYRKACSHLHYVSQDLCQYDGAGNGEGLQTGKWDTKAIDIVSDISNIPVGDGSFDYILCTEVFEHLLNPELAMQEFSRILKREGRLILTAPFTSWTHFAPFHYYTGINRYWYEAMCQKYGMKILEVHAIGNCFRLLQMECACTSKLCRKYFDDFSEENRLQLREANRILARMADKTQFNSELATVSNCGYLLLIEKC